MQSMMKFFLQQRPTFNRQKVYAKPLMDGSRSCIPLMVLRKLLWQSKVARMHWRRQLWGTGARAPPRLPASYFGDHSLYRVWRIMRTVFGKCTKTTRFLRNYYQFLAHFCHFFVQLSSGSNYSSQNAGTIANKFQLHAYFRFR